MRKLTCVAMLFVVVVLSACQSAAPPAAGSASPPSFELYSDLGHFHRAVSTRVPEAQRWFDQGMIFAFAFDHASATRSFQEAARLDPSCAMAWWGIALANGPHINNPMVDPEHAKAAWDAIEKAREFAASASPIERALIDAQAKRYSSTPVENRRAFDEAYANAMRELWHAHPDDADVGSLFAESMMDLRPWDLWTHEGLPQPGTDEIVATLEFVLARAPDHPLANHLYIHAVEASPHPEKALAAADRLRTLVPGASHLVHMPSHIDARIGHYAEAAAANERAIAVDRKRAARTAKTGFYQVYKAHNSHFLVYASMMEGRSAVALDTARAMIASIPPEFLATLGPFGDGFMPTIFHVLVRFGRWDDVLREPEFPPELVVSNAIRHYARAVAFAALDRLDEAEAEERLLATAVAAIDDKRPLGNNTARRTLEVATRMVRGEIAFRRGQVDDSFAILREAVTIEDSLQYDEPPDWMMPVRHALGAALLQAGRVEDAEKVYREDLAKTPDNGWALFGLWRCLELRDRPEEAQNAHARFQKAWSRADVALKSSCFCQPGS
ncbi:MAG: tetratricopeptide repeat protein [Planctomycetes bacterium]|nr:tetratricopeptide repeat protein [Planctomycetota bacterium]